MNPSPLTFTPFDDYSKALDAAAEQWGVEPGYWDIWGRYHETSPEVKRAILESLGVAAGSLEDLNRALEAELWRSWSRPLPPVLVAAEEEAPHRLPLRLPAACACAPATLRLELEDGEIRESSIPLDGIETSAAARLRGREFLEKPVPVPEAPLGYHRIRVSVAAPGQPLLEAFTRWIVAPSRAWLPEELRRGGKRAGLYISLYGLRSERNWGCGDFTDLERLARWVAGAIGGAFIALNPLHAIFNRQPFNTSPYLPNSVYYRNLIYLDVERIEDFQRSAWARRLRRRPAVEAEIRALNAAPLVEYERVHRLKTAFLQLAFRRFLREEYRSGSERAARFRRYVEQEGELLDRFAVHAALSEWLHRRDPNVWVWPQWPEPYRDPGSDAVREFARRHWRRVLFHKYVQWQIDEQLAAVQQAARSCGVSIGLLHDLALATDRCGADLWAHRGLFVEGCRVGAPPDDFSPQGQDWAFPPPASRRHFEDAYERFRESIRKSCRHGGALRIDHAMRFFRLFWIPAGRSPAEGTYVRERHQDLLRILALESVRNRVIVVGEDLGTVAPYIREELARYGILGYRLFYFERDERGAWKPPAAYPAQALVASTTHDLPTLAGFWQGRDIEARRAAGVLPGEDAYRRALEARRRDKQQILDALHSLGLLPEGFPRTAEALPELTGELHNAVIGFLASTPCMLFALNQEDLTKETEQQNLPGTTAEYPNWRRKMRYTLEELETSPEVADFARMFRNWLARTHRLPE